MINGLFSFSLLLMLSLSVYLIWFSGVLNIALEGTFLWAVFSAFFAFHLGFSPLVVLGLTFLSTVFLLGIFYLLHFWAEINENFVGILLNIFVLSSLDLMNQLVFKKQGILFFPNPIENLILFRLFIILLFLTLFFTVSYLLFKTPLGLRLRMASSPSLWKEERGISTEWDRLILLGIAGVLISLVGLVLLLSLNAYTIGLGTGMGWLGLFALLLGFFRLKGIFLASAFLALSLMLSYWIQERVGFQFSKGLPYLSAFIAYALISWWKNKKGKERL